VNSAEKFGVQENTKLFVQLLVEGGVLFSQAFGFVDTGRQVAYQFKVGSMLLGLGWFGVCLVIREVY